MSPQDWQRQEAERRNTELISKIDALKPGERIRVKTNNGNYDVSFDRVEREKELLFFSFDDGLVGVLCAFQPDCVLTLRNLGQETLFCQVEERHLARLARGPSQEAGEGAACRTREDGDL